MQPIFVSSTFRDMQAERDMLNFRVLPEVREFAKERGEAVRLIDLRWGIDTAELEKDETTKKVLSVCFKEIEDSRPYLIAFLGQRYGKIPDKDLVRSAVEARKEDWEELDYLEKSITALEIEYGAFSKKGQPERCLFYYRESLNESLLTPKQREDYLEKSKKLAKKLSDLKARIKGLSGGTVRSYRCTWDAERGRVTGLEDLERMVTEDLKGLLAQDLGERKELTWQEREQRDARLYFREKSEACTARGVLFRGYAAEIAGDDVRLWILRGESGSGKSTAMGRIATELEGMGREVFAFSCGQSGNSSTGLDIVKQAVYHMEKLLSKDHFSIKDEMGALTTVDRGDVFKDWKDRWTELTYEYDRNGLKPVVFLIDALDQLIQDEAVEKFGWLPDGMPGSMRVVVSCLSSFKMPGNLELRSRVRVRELGLMDEADRELVMQGLEKKEVKELAPEIKSRLSGLTHSNNPLYLSMVYQRFLMFDSDDFKEIDRIGKDKTATKKHMLGLIEKAPRDLGEVCQMIMEEAASRINEEQSRYVLLLLAASRNGLREEDIRAIFEKHGMKYNALDYSVLMKYMRPYMGGYADGRVDFTHESIREGYRSNMGAEVRNGLNQVIYEHLEELADDDPVHQAEYVYFAYLCDKKAELVKRIMGYSTDSRQMAGTELHDICMKDEGRWLTGLIEDGKANGAGVSFTSFIGDEFFDSHTLSMKEMSALLPIMIQNSLCCEQLAKELGTPDSRRSLGTSCNNVGHIYYKQGRYDEALKMFLSGLETFEQMAKELGTSENRSDLDTSCNNVGVIYEEQGLLDEALEMFLRSLEISEQLAKELGTPDSRSDLGTSCNNVGYIREEQSRYNEALEMYLKDLEISEQLAKELGTPDSRSDLGISCNRVGEVYNKQGKYEEALEMLLRSLEISEQLAKELGTPDSRRGLGISCNNVGEIYDKQGRYDEALEMFLRSLELREQLAKELGTPDSRRGLGISYNNVGVIYEEQGRLDEALGMYLRYLEISEQLAKELGTPDSRNNLGTSCNNVGVIYEEQGLLDEALEMLLRSLEISEQLAKELGTPDSRSNLGISCNNVGEIYDKQGRYDEALEMYLKGLEISEQLARELGTPESHNNLSIAYERMAGIKEARGQLNEAIRLRLKSLEIRERLAKEIGTKMDRRLLVAAQEDLGTAYKKLGKMKEALEHTRIALEVAKKLLEEDPSSEIDKDKYDTICSYMEIMEEKGNNDL